MTFEIDKTVGVIVGIITIISTLIATHRYAYKRGQKNADNDFKRLARQNRYKLIYAPLRKLLLDKHVTSAIWVQFPRFSQRMKRATKDLKRLKFKSAYIKLKDKNGGKPSAEVEFGGDFPLEEIRKIVEENIQWADSKLIGLVQRADRAQYEQHNGDYAPYYNQLMTDEEFELFNHVFDNFSALNKILTS